MKKGIVFDFDYTLGDSSEGIVLSINYALEKLGYGTKEIGEIKRTIGLSLKDTYSRLTAQSNTDEAEDVQEEKPHPEGLALIIKQMHLDREDVLYVGDSIVDEQTAEHAGVDFAGVLTGTTTRKDFLAYQSAFIGETIKDIYSYILRHI